MVSILGLQFNAWYYRQQWVANRIRYFLKIFRYFIKDITHLSNANVFLFCFSRYNSLKTRIIS